MLALCEKLGFAVSTDPGDAMIKRATLRLTG